MKGGASIIFLKSQPLLLENLWETSKRKFPYTDCINSI